MSTAITHNRPGFWSRMVAFAESYPRMHSLCALASFSDEDLAARGTTREGELQRILGVRRYF